MRGFLIFIGVMVIVVGWAAAIYVGIWLMFIGGIIQIIEGAKMDPVSSFDVAWGIARVTLCELASIIGIVGSLIGSMICTLGRPKPKSLSGMQEFLAQRSRARRP